MWVMALIAPIDVMVWVEARWDEGCVLSTRVMV